MAIPDYQACMLPFLKAIADGAEHRIRDVTSHIATQFNLSDEQREELLPSGQQTVIANRVGWAKTYMKKAGLIQNPGRGRVRITAEGAAVLNQGLPSLDKRFLEQYPAFLEFVRAEREEISPNPPLNGEPKTPDEVLETSYRALRNELAEELIERVKACSPVFFERLVVQLLVAMGYGGSLADAGQAVGRSGDGGIDGIIKEDKLGLDIVCIQAKRWDRSVGRPEVQAFAGSMEGFRARKGVLITTSGFTKDAVDYISRIERKIVLIDGPKLAQFMIDHDIGTASAHTYVVKKVDLDYFVEDDI